MMINVKMLDTVWQSRIRFSAGSVRRAVTVTQFRLGARGIDWIRNKVGSDPETIVFPIYDGHGNMIYTLTREANDGHDLGNERIYGAWGDLRQDSNPGDGPNTQYVGNLGHKKDNESGLTYMRARYYEPWTGRFISEDLALHGNNWFVYCANNPTNLVDVDGNEPIQLTEIDSVKFFIMSLGLIAVGLSVVMATEAKSKAELIRVINIATLGVAMVAYGGTIGKFGYTLEAVNQLAGLVIFRVVLGLYLTGNIKYGPVQAYVWAIAAYSLVVMGATFWGLHLEYGD